MDIANDNKKVSTLNPVCSSRCKHPLVWAPTSNGKVSQMRRCQTAAYAAEVAQFRGLSRGEALRVALGSASAPDLQGLGLVGAVVKALK